VSPNRSVAPAAAEAERLQRTCQTVGLQASDRPFERRTAHLESCDQGARATLASRAVTVAPWRLSVTFCPQNGAVWCVRRARMGDRDGRWWSRTAFCGCQSDVLIPCGDGTGARSPTSTSRGAPLHCLLPKSLDDGARWHRFRYKIDQRARRARSQGSLKHSIRQLGSYGVRDAATSARCRPGLVPWRSPEGPDRRSPGTFRRFHVHFASRSSSRSSPAPPNATNQKYRHVWVVRYSQKHIEWTFTQDVSPRT